MTTPILLSNNTNTLIVGKITHIEGTATALSPDGHVRNLKEGDPIYLNDVIHTSGTGESTIKLVNGAVYTLEGASSVTLNPASLKAITSQAFPETVQAQQAEHGHQNNAHIQYSGEQGNVYSGFTTHACGSTATSHAQVVGTVHCAEGFVTAVGANGEIRLLNAGDQVYAGDVITSSENSTASITEANGQSYNVSPGESASAGACSDYSDETTAWFDNTAFGEITFLGLTSSITSGFDTSGGLGAPAPPPPPPPVLVNQQADLTLTITHSTTNVTPGTTDPYTYTIVNSGPDPVSGAAVVSSLPTGLFTNIVVTGLPAGASFINFNNGTIEFAGLNISAGQEIQIQLSGTVDSNLRVGTDTFIDSGTISPPANVTDTNPNNSATSYVNVTPEALLTLTNTDKSTTATPGTSVTFDVTLTSAGPSNLTGVTILDTLPTGLTNVTSTGLPAGVSFINLGNGQVEWTGIIISSGQSVPLEITGTINPSLSSTATFTNTVQVIPPTGDNSTASNTPPPLPDSNTVTPQAHMTITTLADGTSSEIVNVGQTVTYTITLGNTGPSDATNVQVQDILSSLSGIDFNLNSATVNEGTLTTTGGNLTWDIASVGVNGVDQPFAPTLTITGIVTGVPPSITDSATVTATDSPTATSSATININADVAVTATVSAGDSVVLSAIGSVTVGSEQDVTYQLTASNIGGTTATTVIVTDDLPSNFSLNHASIDPSVGTVSISAGVLTWTIPTLAAAADATLTYTETTNAPSVITVDPTTINISSSQTNEYGEASPQDTSYTTNTTVIPQENISITDSDSSLTAVPGTSDTYTITIHNGGPSALTDGTVIDTLPSGFTFSSEIGSGVTFTNIGGGQVEWTGLNLASGATETLTLTGLIDPNLVSQDAFSNIAQVYVPNGQINTNNTNTESASNTVITYTATASDSVIPTANLSIVMTDATNNNTYGANGTYSETTNSTTGGIAVPGSASSEVYTITISNINGPSNITNVNLSDVLPAGISGDMWSVDNALTTGGASALQSTGTGPLSDRLDLPANSSITFIIDATIPPGSTAPLVNTATITPPSGVDDTNAFNSSTDVVSLTPVANLSINNINTLTTVTPGQSDTFDITLTNNGGPSNLTNLTVTDTLPAGFLTNLTGSSLPAGVNFIDLGNGQVEWTGINLTTTGASSTVTLQLTGTVNPDVAAGTVTTTAQVVIPPGEVDSGSPTSSVTSNTVTPEGSLTITNTDSTGIVIPGTQETYNVNVANSGPSDLTGLTIVDTLPTDFTSVSSPDLPAGVSFINLGNGQVEWTGVTVDANQNINLQLQGTYTSNLSAATVTNTAQVTTPANEDNTNPTTSAADIDTVSPHSNISIALTDSDSGTFNASTNNTSGGTAEPGTTTTNLYTLVVTNNGPSDVTGATIADMLPAGFTSDSWTATTSSGASITSGGSSGDSVDSTGNINDTVNLASGSSITYLITGTINPSATGTITDTGTVTTPAGTTDTNSFTSSSDTLTLVPTANLAVSNSDNSGGTVTPGDTYTFTINVANNMPSNLTGLTVIDTLPAGLTNITINPASLPAGVTFTNLENGTVEFTGVNVASGSNTQLQFMGTVDSTLAAGTGTFTNSVTSVSAPAGEVANVTYATPPNDNVSPQANLSIAVTDSFDQTPGTLTMSNVSGNDTSGGVVVAGTTEIYTIVVTNTGSSDVTGATIADTLPASIAADNWSAILSGGASITSGGSNGSGSISDIANLPVGSSITYTIDANVSSSASTTMPLDNTATITVPAGVTVVYPADTSSTDAETVQNPVMPSADVAVQLSDNAAGSLPFNTSTNDTTGGTAAPGTSIVYTVEVSNTGPSAVTGATLTDILPAGISGDTWSVDNALTTGGATAASPGGSGPVSDVLDLPANSSITLIIDATISPDATGPLTNSAMVTPPVTINDSNAFTQSLDVVSLQPSANLTITNSNTLTTVTPGQSDTFDITLTNNGGPSNLTNLTVTDTLPAGFLTNLTGSSLPAGINFIDLGNGQVEWTGINLTTTGASSTVTLQLTGTVNPDVAAGTVTTTAQVVIPPGEVDSGSPTSSVTSNTVTPEGSLTITNTDSTGIVIPGTQETYNVNVANSGPSDLTGLTIVDTLPTDFTSVSSPDLPAGVSFINLGNGQVEWTGVTVDANQNINLQLQGTYTSNLSAATVTNTAQVTTPANEDNTNPTTSAADIDTVSPHSNISIALTDSDSGTFNASTNNTSGGTAEPGTTTTNLYTLVVTNNGPSDVTGATIADMLPAGFTSDSWTATTSSGASITSGGSSGDSVDSTGNINDTVNLASGSSITYLITGTINPSATGTITDTGTVTTPAGTTDTNSFTSSSDTLTLVPTANLAVSNSDNSGGTVTPGDTYTFTINVANNMPSNLTGLTVIDTLPAGLTNITINPASLPAGVTFTNLENGTVEFTGVNVASGSNTQLQFMGTVDSTLAVGTGTFTNSVTSVSAPAGEVANVTYATPPNDNVAPQTSLSITNNVDGASTEMANIGQIVTYTVQLTNNGPSAATGVSVADVIPSGLLVIGDNAPAGTTYNPNTGTWTVNTLAAGATETLTLEAQVSTTTSPVPSSITSTAIVSANDASSVSSTATITVNPEVGVNMTVNGGDNVLNGSGTNVAVGAGQDVTFQLTASNTGGTSASNVMISDTLPTGFTMDNASITPSVGTVIIEGGVLTWTIPTLAAAANATLTYTETNNNAPSTITVDPNTATITSGNTNPADNSATSNVSVIPQGNITIANSDGTTAVIPGNSDTYTITVTNNGPSQISNATVFDFLPADFTVTGQTSSGVTYSTVGSGQVEWTGLTLASGASATFTITGTVDPNLPQGTATNIAQVSVPSEQINSNVIYTATDTDNVNPTANLSIKMTDSGDFVSGTYSNSNNDTTGGIAIPGDSTVYTITVSNTGPSNVTGVNVADLLPAGISSDSWTAVLSGTGASITSGGSSGNSADSTGNINDIVNLASGSYITYTIDANIAAGATATLNNTATLSLPAGLTDTNSFQSSTDTLALQSHGGISVTNTDGTTSVTAGSQDTYHISVTNGGPSNISGVTIIDTLPKGTITNTATGLPSTITGGFTNVTSPNLPTGVQFINLNNGQVEWIVSNLASLQTLNLQLVGTVDPSLSAGSGFDNSVSVTVPSGEVNTNNNATTTTVTDINSVSATADLQILNLVDGLSKETVTHGSIVLYTIQISNDGALSATGVDVTNALSTAGLTFISDTTTAGSYNPNTGLWTVGTVASGATDTLTIEAIANATTTSTATVTSSNAATESSTVVLTDPAPSYPNFLGIIDLATGAILTGNSSNNSNSSQNTSNNSNPSHNINSGNNHSTNVLPVTNSDHNYNNHLPGHGEHVNTDTLKFNSVIDNHDFVKQFHDSSVNLNNNINLDALLNNMHKSENPINPVEHSTNSDTIANANPKDCAYAAASAFTFASLAFDPSSHHPLNNEEHIQHIHHVA